MLSNENSRTAGQPYANPLGDAEPDPLWGSSQTGLGECTNLTHRERVEREQAFVRRMARAGIWSAIE
jgi:hypothetical protein